MNENIFKALGTFLDSMRPYIKKVIEDNFQGEPWEGEFFRRLKPQRQEMWNQAQQQGVASLLRIDLVKTSVIKARPTRWRTVYVN